MKMNIDKSVFIAPGATVVGDVTIGAESSVWYGCVLRGDTGAIEIGRRVNVQDGCILHEEIHIADNVSIGHGAIVHGCTLEEGVLIGMGAIVLSGAHVGKGAVVAAGAVVTEGMEIPAGMMAMGCPAKVRGPVSEKTQAYTALVPQEYVDLSRQAMKDLGQL
jgi:carbonic anhydrase/acetyltransferase-like protein (isoleucine patch superfamily)